MSRLKRPSVALPPATTARAIELWAGGPKSGGLSFRAVERQLKTEQKPASLAAIHSACMASLEDDAPAAVDGAVAPADPVEPDLEAVDEAEAAEESDAIRAEALAGARAALAVGESRTADTLTKVAERMVKLSRLLRGRAPGRTPTRTTNVQVNVLTPAEARVVEGLGG